MKKFAIIIAVLTALTTALTLAIYGGIAYVALHFIHKAW